MTLWQSIFLGLLQGLTEFLPISSSGHLILAEKIFCLEQNLFVNVILHLGTLLAVCLAMRKSIGDLFRFKNKKMLYLILATLPSIAIAAVVKLFIPESFLNNLLPIGFALTIVLLVFQHYFSKQRRLLTSALPPIVAGIVQGVAVLPGLSRSGSTIATLSFFGIERKSCAEFSFLMSIPIIAGAGAVEIFQIIIQPSLIPATITVGYLLIGVGVAFVTAFFSIKLMLKIIGKAKLVYFAIYLLIPLTLSLILL